MFNFLVNNKQTPAQPPLRGHLLWSRGYPLNRAPVYIIFRKQVSPSFIYFSFKTTKVISLAGFYIKGRSMMISCYMRLLKWNQRKMYSFFAPLLCKLIMVTRSYAPERNYNFRLAILTINS